MTSQAQINTVRIGKFMKDKVRVKTIHFPYSIARKNMTLEQKGYKVYHPTKADSDRIWHFMEEHFNDDEPICRSLGVNKNDTWIDTFVRNQVRQHFVEPCLLESTSIVIEDSNGDIAGIKLGHPISIDHLPTSGFWTLDWVRKFPWLVPAKLYQYTYFTEFQTSEKYCNLNPVSLLNNLNLRKVFFGDILSVSRDHRRKGLATELVQRSEQLAKECGSEGYLVESSGIYSQKTYSKNHFKVLKELFYGDFKDGLGNIVFNDTMEHKSVKMMFKPLS